MADEVAITGRVVGKLTNLVVTRDGNKVAAEWKIPAYLNDPSYSRRLTSVDGYIDFNCDPDSNKQVAEVWRQTFGVTGRKPLATTLNYDHYFVRGLESGAQATSANAGVDFEKPYDRNRYYPKTSKKCTGVKIGVCGVNGYGSHGDTFLRGPVIYQTFALSKPQKPKCEFSGWNEESNYRAEYAIDANPGDQDEAKNNAERYDTRYRILRQDNLPNSGYAKKKVVKDWTTTRADTVSGNQASDNRILGLADGQWLELTLEAYSRGMAGDSSTHTVKLVASRPARATIKSVKASAVDMVKGIVTVKCTIPSDAHRWTTKAKLQRLKDVDPTKTASEVAALSGWEDVTGMVQVDDLYKDATWDSSFVDSVASAYPTSANKKTWYRVVTENDLYSGDNAYQSVPVEAKQLYRKQTATNDRVYIESLSTNEDATAVKVKVGWPNDDSTGTEISWSTHEDAWESSEQPSTALVTWKDATSQGSYANSASFTIYGVEQGQEVYVKARRYYQNADGEIVDYSAYATAASSSMWPFVPAMPPSEVQLVAPTFVPRGSDLPLTWTFKSDAPQTAWVVYEVAETTSGGVTSISSREGIASGEDAFGACTIPADKLSGDSVKLTVSITTGSEWAESQVAEVMFADAPEITVTYPSASDPDYTTTYPLLLEQPMTLYCESDTGNDMLHVRVLSNGIAYDMPDGSYSQADGEPVFDAWVQPAWGEDSGSYYAAITLPADVPFVDVGVYTWEVTAQNNTSGLLSETQAGLVKVRWAHQAHLPGEGSTAVPDDGMRTVTVTPASPDNFAPADVFDLYRVTPDGVDLIAAGLRFGTSVLDRYAPFGEGTYRIATRTVDGDVAWADFEYSLPCAKLRFDWGDTFVELPYNLVRQDSWAKDFEERAHLDGERTGFWNDGASRSASFSTDLMRFSDRETQNLVRQLATYAGPVFVRVPNGCSYQANVDVGGLDESYQSGAVSASFSATQVALTDAFMVAQSDVDASNVEEYEPSSYDRSEVLSWSATAPTSGSTYELMAEPSGTVMVELTASHDYYSDTWSVPNTVSGTTVTLGTFSSALQAFIADAVAEEANIRLMARYDVEG